ncbi:S-layer homology domain-containing protein [Patescibacteria group bacterium]|nr:S-layer homology domain-containing protein [Patescibacteria group bacterium]MBU1683710.1 S-layer homology domain-containing protein [Patescibacteria group bacterium]
MKKILLTLFTLLALSSISYAGDCFQDPIYDRDWNGVVITGMFVRDIACMEGSSILTTVPVGQVVHVIGETDGWYKVETSDGITGWSGQWLLTATDQAFKQSVQEATAEPLYDVTGHDYETAIRYLGGNEIIEGYSDGSYQPDKTVNRAEFTKIIVGAKLGAEPTSYSGSCFPDVPSGEWYESYVCYAKDAGIIGGYPDGYFRPSNNINLAEAAKILVNTLEVEIPAVESNLWYQEYIEAMQNNSYIPQSFSALDQNVTRGEMAEMTWRILEEVKDQPFTQFDFTEAVGEAGYTSCADSNIPSSIDMDEVRETWLTWYNDARATRGLHAYTYNGYLDYSAAVWSQYCRDIGTMSHSRPGQTEYYDYSMITDWFADLGLTFENHSGVTYSENIGYATYRCSDSDCTQELLDGVKMVFDAYMAEEGTSYTAHYDSVTNSYFNEIGVGFAIDSSDNWVYVTVHYATALSSHPEGTCNL